MIFSRIPTWMTCSTMPTFPIQFRTHILSLNPTRTIPLARPYLVIDLGAGRVSPQYCFVDTGAPVSVVSYSIRRLLHYRPISLDRRTLGSNHAAGATFQGAATDFGTADLRLVDLRTQQRGTYAVEGKFLRRPTTFSRDMFVILGMNFFLAHDATFEFSRSPVQPWNLAGTVTLP
jgi:hypothetical protein